MDAASIFNRNNQQNNSQTNPEKNDLGKKDKKSHSHSLFGSSVKKPEEHQMNDLTKVSADINNVSRRLRILEERYINLRKKTQLTEQNMLSTNKKILAQVRESFDEITEIRNEIKKIQDQIATMGSELSDCANRNDLLTVDKYVNYWNPMNFITESEARRIIEEYKENH